MNLNVPRIDNGTGLTADELPSNVIGFGRWADRSPMAAECCTDTEDDKPAPRRKARVNWWGVAMLFGLALSGAFVVFVIGIGWRLATKQF
jgi:hypothetical protein